MEETVIGTLFGKKLYRKGYTTTVSTSTYVQTLDKLSNVLPNLDVMLNYYGWLATDDGVLLKIPYSKGGDAFTASCNLWFYKTQDKLYVSCFSSGGTLTVFFEYTKTTD
jgi:hypothetical protein